MIRELTITRAQSDLLAALGAEAQKAQHAFQMTYAGIIRGHDVTEATLVKLDGPTLTVEVPDAPA